ncbi:MAG TPA: NAD(+)/NADH kinase [Anaerolineales bacterium]|jgi:NAD+ kinase
MTSSFIPNRIVVTGHPKLPESLEETIAIAAYLKEKGLECPHGSLYDEKLRKRIHAGEFDLLIAVGGDGTMLRAGHLCGPHDVPVLGVNKGRLGFLFQVMDGGWQTMIERMLQGDFWIEKRMMLRADHIRSGETLGSWQALNDVVVSRGQFVRPIQVKASVDEQYLTTYVADGVIASSATGSTAYALASGGPILPPELRNILLVPIAPHLSVDRAVVLAEGTTVSLTVLSENSVLSVDGQIPVGLAEEDRVDIHAADDIVKFVRFGDPGYFYRNLTAHMNQNSTIGLPR